MISAVVIGLVAVVPLFRNRSTVAAWLATIGLLLMMGVRKGVRGSSPLGCTLVRAGFKGLSERIWA